jgi:nucleoside-diphosphate-sugar epimerase
MAGNERDKKLSGYGRSKLLAEGILQKTWVNDSCFILRPRGIYGAGDKVLLPRLLKLVRHNKMIRPGSMNVHLSMTHFSNFAMAVESCLHSQKKGFTTYNVADDKTYVLYDIVKKLLNTLYHADLQEKKNPSLDITMYVGFKNRRCNAIIYKHRFKKFRTRYI